MRIGLAAVLAALIGVGPVLAQEAPAPRPGAQSAPDPAAEAAAAELIAIGEKTAPAAPLDPGATAGPKVGEYRFVLSFEETAVEGMGLVRSNFERDGLFQTILDTLSDEIALPQDIPVTFKDCDDENAFWNPEDRSLTMCWDLVALYNRGYSADEGGDRVFIGGVDPDIVLTGTTTFILLHELGHGLIDLFDIPTTGREEDTVDQFATLMLIGGDEPGDKLTERPSYLALLGAYFFRSLATEPGDLGREILADEHALGQQRYYDVMCLVLGSDEEAYAPILTPGLLMVSEAQEKAPDQFDEARVADWLEKTDALNVLPYARAIGCADEYQKYEASWGFLVDHFMTPQAADEGAADQPATAQPAADKAPQGEKTAD